MDDPAKKGTGTAPAPAAKPVIEADEFAAIPRPRTRHPLLALGAAVLALALVVKMRTDLAFFMSPRQAADLGDARTLLASDRGRAVLREGTNRLVRVQGTPDRESALQVDTKGSWTFTQFFKILGTDSQLFIHRREDPLPGFRAERDDFQGRLLRFSDLSFQDSIRAHFAGHVTTTHFFAAADLRRVVATGTNQATTLRDLAGDNVTLGPNDILAFDLRHAGEIEVALPVERFPKPEAARAALVARGARDIRAGRSAVGQHVFVVSITAEERDRVMHDIGDIDYRTKIRDVREAVKARLGDLTIAGAGTSGELAIKGADSAPGTATAAPGTARTLNNIVTVRALGTVQIPSDAYLIVEAETPRDHLPEVAIALVLLVFASVNLGGLVRGVRR